MKEFETKNVFLSSVIFGFNQKTHLVIAENKKDVKKLLDEIYYKPEIKYIINYNEMNDIYQKMLQSKNFCMVVEMKEENSINKLIQHYELEQELSEIRLRYASKKCFFINEEMMAEILKFFKEEMDNPKEKPLISKVFKS